MTNDTETRRKDVVHAKYLKGIMEETWSIEMAELQRQLYEESIKDSPSWGRGWCLTDAIGKLRLKESK